MSDEPNQKSFTINGRRFTFETTLGDIQPGQVSIGPGNTEAESVKRYEELFLAYANLSEDQREAISEMMSGKDSIDGCNIQTIHNRNC